MSYTVDAQTAYFAGGHRPRTVSLLDKKGVFPTGLAYIALEYLRPLGAKVVDLRVRPKSSPGLFSLKLEHKPYLEQGEAVKAAVGAARGIISAVTGSGKSLVAGLLINALQVRTLIVVPSLELRSQLTESMVRWFGKGKVGKGKDIWIENVQALDPGSPVIGYDCVIVDEFHHSGAKTYRKLNVKAWNGIYYRFGLSATPFRNSDDERLLLESVLSQVVYRIDYKKASDNGYIVPVEGYYFELPKQETDAHTWAQVYSELVVKNDRRNITISGLLKDLRDADKFCLCLVKEIAHGEELSAMTGVPFVNGQDGTTREYIEKFNSGEIKVLIGTTGVIGEGVDSRPCEYVVIAGLGKAKSAFMQQVGRALRRYGDKQSAKIIIVCDKSHKFTLKHFKEQCKILRDEYGVTAIKLDL